MPELPEVQSIVNELQSCILGKTLQKITILRKGVVDNPALLQRKSRNKTIKKIYRRAKYICIVFNGNDGLLIHLRMTGKFLYNADMKKKLYQRVVFFFTDTTTLFYSDVRCLGIVKYTCSFEKENSLIHLGTEPLQSSFTSIALQKMLSTTKTPIKKFLMSQKYVVGIGNIYAAEILFHAQIHPEKPSQKLQKNEIQKIFRAIRTILKKAILYNGTTISDYRRVDEKTGNFQNLLQVYGKNDQQCKKCNNTIQKIKQNSRSTFFCPFCQKM